ncbi:MAG: hypothetical protein KDB36_05205 [Acidimicrobiales bacterium]|nr:hypothetical protein [Acidimicrobiales bacterium]
MTTDLAGPNARVERGVLLALLADEGRTAVGANLVCSPAMVRFGLAVLATGARGATAAALDAFLGVDADAAAAMVADDLAALGLLNDGAALEPDLVAVAAALWARVPIYARWRERLPAVGVGQLGVDDPDAWAAEATGGRIDRLAVSSGPEVLAVLTLAARLRATWWRPFSPAETVDGTFAGVDRPVPFMRQRSRLHQVWRAGDVEAVAVRYGSPFVHPWGGLMLVVGAAGNDPVEATAAVLDLVEHDPRPHTEVDLSLPRFRIDRRGDAAIDLRPALTACGLDVLFDDRCDLGGISPEPLKLSEALSQAIIEVDEEGTTAAATLELAMVAGGGPPVTEPELVSVVVDRPFAFLVRLGERGPILFGGWVQDPTAS